MSTLPTGYRTVEVPPERTAELRAVDELAFANTPDPELDALYPFPIPEGRAMAVEDPDGRLAAVHGSFAFDMPVTGGSVPCSGLTWVGVRPDERRRGLLRSMIGTHFARSLERGEPVSALFAAEAPIYGRFGYGSAADDMRMTLPRGAALRPVAGSEDLTVRLEELDASLHGLLEDLHVRSGAGRPGWMPRATPELRAQVFVEAPSRRHGFDPRRVVTVRDGDEVRAVAGFARKGEWGEGGPDGTVRVSFASALDAAARHRLWTFLLDLDLMARVETPMLPVDDPLLTLLVDPRPTRRRVGDNVWVRLLDVPTALAARSYDGELDVVLDVTDAMLPENARRWRLVVDAAGDVEVTPTDAEGDVRIDVRELGALYLGGRSATAQAAAGLVHGDPATLARLTSAFLSPLAPVCPWIF